MSASLRLVLSRSLDPLSWMALADLNEEEGEDGASAHCRAVARLLSSPLRPNDASRAVGVLLWSVPTSVRCVLRGESLPGDWLLEEPHLAGCDFCRGCLRGGGGMPLTDSRCIVRNPMNGGAIILSRPWPLPFLCRED